MRAALEQLWTEHRAWVAAVVESTRPRDHDFEDLMQEVALRFVSKLAQLDDPTRLRPWLRQIARNVCTDAGRRARLRRTESVELDAILPLDEAQSSTLRIVDARDELARTRAALDALDADTREVLALRAIEGMSHRQLAETLDVPVTTIESRLVRARRALRRALAASSATPKPNRCLR